MARARAPAAWVRLCCALLGLLLFCACSRKASDEGNRAPPAASVAGHDSQFEVVIVGGGLAGLSAAFELRGRQVLLLEKEPRLGGRVHTKQRDGLSYELGALFAYPVGALPRSRTPSPVVPGVSRVGLSQRGRVTFGATVSELVKALDGANSPLAEQAFFGVIHPGEMAEYVPNRQNDWAITYSTSRSEAGNRELVTALAEESRASILLDARATRVREVHDRVEVDYSTGGRHKTARARAAIVATPANATAQLLGDLVKDSPIRRVRYAPGLVVVLGVRGGALEPFGYVASPDAGLSAVFSSVQGDTRVLTIYYARREIAPLSGLATEQVVARTVERVNALGIGKLATADVAFSDVQHWPSLGTIISADPYEEWTPEATRPTKAIFLAGDYTHWNVQQMPYGMPAAIGSGREAGRAALDYLSGRKPRAPAAAPVSVADEAKPAAPTPTETFMLHAALGLPTPRASEQAPLTTCEVFRLGDQAPAYVGQLAEGSVAPYGILLLGKSDAAIAQRLLRARVNGLWEYSPGYGTTAADSALVLEGLFAAGVDRAILIDSLTRIRDEFYDRESGAFTTIKRGRAAYWTGPSNDTTAQIAYLMQSIAPDRFAQEIASAARYLLAHQEQRGDWKGRWYPSWVLPTSYAVRFLSAAAGKEQRAAIERALGFVARLQRADGSIAGSTIETALSVMALKAAGTHPEVLKRAEAWLRARTPRGIPAGEPVLYYWFDDPKRGRAFFTCRDRGRLAAAWAEAALRSVH
jgi:predicted NAD/FAD-dependent oxidoreductase